MAASDVSPGVWIEWNDVVGWHALCSGDSSEFFTGVTFCGDFCQLESHLFS